ILESGDKIFSRFETLVHTVVESDGSRKSSYTTVTTLTGGTGKARTIRGTSRGAGTTDFKSGLSGVKTEGEYWFEKGCAFSEPLPARRGGSEAAPPDAPAGAVGAPQAHAPRASEA